MPRIALRNYAASLAFNGTANSMATGSISSIISSAGAPYSFVSWVFVARVLANTRFMALSAHSYLTYDNLTRQFRAVLARNTGDSITNSSTVFNAGAWYRVGYTWDGNINNQPKLYVNGLDVSVPGSTGSGTLPAISAIALGARTTGANSLTGSMSDARLYTRELTASEMLGDYVSGTVFYGIGCRWKLDEGSGTTANCMISGNNLTITNAAWSPNNVPLGSRSAASGRAVPVKSRQPVGELLYNGDFEHAPANGTTNTTTVSRWIDGTAGGSLVDLGYGWAMSLTSAGTVASRFDNTEVLRGGRSMKIATLATASRVDVIPARDAGAANVIKYGIPVMPSTSYTGTYWMKTNYVSGDGLGADVSFREFSGVGAIGLANDGTFIKTTTGWTMYTVQFTTAATTRFILPRVQIVGTSGAGTLIMDAWFDDIKLTRGTPISRQLLT